MKIKINKYLLVLIIVIATSLQYKQYVVSYGADNIIQLLSGTNLAKGNQISLPHINRSDWAIIDYIPQGDWAAGIAVFTAIVFPVIQNPIHIIYLQSFLFILLYFIFFVLTLKKLDISERKIIFIIFLSAICYAPFRYLNPSGLASLSTFMMGLYYCIDWIDKEKQGEKNSLLYLFFVGFVLFLPSFFRFAYYPSGPSLLLGFLLIKVILKQKIKINNVAFVSLSFIFFTCLQLYYQKSIETVNFLENRDIFQREKFLYFENVKLMSPIALDTLFPSSTWASKVKNYFNIPTGFLSIVTHLISLSIVIFYAVMLRNTWGNMKSSIKQFCILLFTGAICNWFFMLALSLYYPSWLMGNRTFLTLERYLAPVSIFFMIIILLLYHHTKLSKYFVYLILSFNLLVYANSVRVYGFWNLKSQMDIKIPKRFELVDEVESILSTEMHTAILSNQLTEAYFPAFLKESIAIGELDSYLEQAQKKTINVSAPVQLLILYYGSASRQLEKQLNSIFINKKIKRIDIKKDTVIFEIYLL